MFFIATYSANFITQMILIMKFIVLLTLKCSYSLLWKTVAGFIMMCPQLFINYKLKSVAHLPWRQMTYKFLNTIIDDLFAFVIKMPTLHRLSVFRDGKIGSMTTCYIATSSDTEDSVILRLICLWCMKCFLFFFFFLFSFQQRRYLRPDEGRKKGGLTVVE